MESISRPFTTPMGQWSHTMPEKVSVLRLSVMRCMFLLNFVLAVLTALGIRYPLAMLPLILYVVNHYIKNSGDRWRSVPQGAAQ